MLDKKCKANVNSLLCNKTYPFMYNMKITEPKQFPDLEKFYIDNFQVFTSVAVEMQLQAWNFNPKKANKVSCSYSFKPVGLYRIEDIQLAPLLKLKKRQRQDNKWISTSPQIKITNSALNLL